MADMRAVVKDVHDPVKGNMRAVVKDVHNPVKGSMRAVVKDVHDPVKAAAALKALPKDYKEVDRQAYHWANVILERFDEDTAMKASRVRTVKK
eukprot:1195861-Prorocentrum_minimum.AAC.3